MLWQYDNKNSTESLATYIAMGLIWGILWVAVCTTVPVLSIAIAFLITGGLVSSLVFYLGLGKFPENKKVQACDRVIVYSRRAHLPQRLQLLVCVRRHIVDSVRHPAGIFTRSFQYFRHQFYRIVHQRNPDRLLHWW